MGLLRSTMDVTRAFPSAAGDEDDCHLVEAARVGAKRAFGELVERHQALVSAVAFALTGNLARSEEITQDVFVFAWKQLSRLRDPKRFRSYMYQITRNLSRASLRRQLKVVPIRSIPGVGADVPSS